MQYECHNLVKKYHSGGGELYALKNVDVNFEQGKITTILGPSGSGKTTLLNMVSGLDKVDSGEILFEGTDISGYSESKLSKYRRENTGFIFQSYNLISTLSVRENIELGEYLSKNSLDIDEILEEVGLTEHADKFPHQLSGGQQQRVAIARAIINNPAVVIADEPTGNLDPESSKEIMNLLEEISRRGTTVVMVTHDRQMVNTYKHRTITIESGYISHDTKNGGYNDDLQSW